MSRADAAAWRGGPTWKTLRSRATSLRSGALGPAPPHRGLQGAVTLSCHRLHSGLAGRLSPLPGGDEVNGLDSQKRKFFNK